MPLRHRLLAVFALIALGACSPEAADHPKYRISPSCQKIATPTSGEIVEVQEEDCCRWLNEQSMPPVQAEIDSLKAAKDRCRYFLASGFWVVVSDIPENETIEYSSVLEVAKQAARDAGYHGVVYHYKTGSQSQGFAYNFSGVYRKNEVPKEFKGLI